MQRQARLPEIFDQIAQFTPNLELGSRTPSPPDNWNFGQILALWVLGFDFPPPQKKLQFRQILHFGFWRLEYVETNRCIPQGYHPV